MIRSILLPMLSFRRSITTTVRNNNNNNCSNYYYYNNHHHHYYGRSLLHYVRFSSTVAHYIATAIMKSNVVMKTIIGSHQHHHRYNNNHNNSTTAAILFTSFTTSYSIIKKMYFSSVISRSSNIDEVSMESFLESLPEPQYPLPILIPPSHIIVENAPTKHTKRTKVSPLLPIPTISQQIQHLYKKHLSISYQQNVIIQGEALFQAVWQHSNLPEWYGPGRIGRDFRSRHAVLTFHLWLIHKRLLLHENLEEIFDHTAADKEDATIATSQNAGNRTIRSYRKDYNMCNDIDEELFNIFWDNTTCRIRALNVYELTVNKHLTNVQKYSFIHLVQYDHCYTKEMLENPKERLNFLRQVVANQWLRPKFIDQRNQAYDAGTLNSRDPNTRQLQPIDDIEDIYRTTCHHVDRIVHYIDAQYCNIMYDLPYDHFTNGHVRFIPLPNFANLHDITTPTGDYTHLTTQQDTLNNSPDSSSNNNNNNNSNTGGIRSNKILMDNIPFMEYNDTPVPCNVDDILPHPWVTNITNSGKIYYWNTQTRKSSWIKPTINDTTTTTV